MGGEQSGRQVRTWSKTSAAARVLAGIAALLLLVVLGAVPFLLAASGAQPHCNRGRLFERARMLDKAESSYAAAADDEKPCGVAGLNRIATAKQRAARSFESAGALAARPHEAIGNYVRGLAVDPLDPAASEQLDAALAALGKPKSAADAGYRCRLTRKLTIAGLLPQARTALSQAFENSKSRAKKTCGKALRRLGRRRERATAGLQRARMEEAAGSAPAARTLFAISVYLDPASDAARTGLEGSLDENTRLDSALAWLEGTVDWLKGALPWLVPLLIGLLLIAVILWSLLRWAASTWPSVFRGLCRLGTWPLLRFLRRAAMPKLQVSKFDCESKNVGIAGPEFRAALLETLPKPALRAPAFPFDRAAHGSGEDQRAAEIVDVLDAVSGASALGVLVKAVAPLFKQRTVELSGALLPVGDLGAGVTVMIDGSGTKDAASVTIWEAMFDPSPATDGQGAERWIRLVAPAAVWTRWQLQAVADPGKTVDAETWRADALFQAGNVWQLKDEWSKAENLYAQALERDPGLLPAAHNLGKLEMRRGLYWQAIARLKTLLWRLKHEKSPPDGSRPSELWPALKPSTRYSLTLARAYQEMEGETEQGAPTALKTAGKLVKEITTTIIDHEEEQETNREKPETEDPDEAKELLNVELPSIVVLAGLKVRSDAEEARLARRHLPERSDPFDPLPRGSLLRETVLREAASRPAWELIELYVLRQRSITPRTRYNLACYFTTVARLSPLRGRGRCLDRALDELELALEGGEVAAWAKKDPSLEFLQEKRAKAFAEIVTKRL